MIPIWQILEKLTVKEKLELGDILNCQPELLSYLEKLFYEKLEAVNNDDEKRLRKIYDEEKEMVANLLGELIKESYA